MNIQNNDRSTIFPRQANGDTTTATAKANQQLHQTYSEPKGSQNAPSWNNNTFLLSLIIRLISQLLAALDKFASEKPPQDPVRPVYGAPVPRPDQGVRPVYGAPVQPPIDSVRPVYGGAIEAPVDPVRPVYGAPISPPGELARPVYGAPVSMGEDKKS